MVELAENKGREEEWDDLSDFIPQASISLTKIIEDIQARQTFGLRYEKQLSTNWRSTDLGNTKLKPFMDAKKGDETLTAAELEFGEKIHFYT